MEYVRQEISDIIESNRECGETEIIIGGHLPNSIIKDLVAIKEEKPQLVILDIMMPEMDGIETCSIIRQTPGIEHTLIVFLTARGEDYSQIAGFDAGADDYIRKPVKPQVLVSRVRALLRRLNPSEQPQDLIKTKDFIIDKERYIVIKDDQNIALSKKEVNSLNCVGWLQGFS